MEEMCESAPETEDSYRMSVLQANEAGAMSQYSGWRQGWSRALRAGGRREFPESGNQFPGGRPGKGVAISENPDSLEGLIWPEGVKSSVKSGQGSLLVDVMLSGCPGEKRERFVRRVAGHFAVVSRAFEDGYFGAGRLCGMVI